MSSVWTFLLIWGVWLITPVLFDGGDALFRLMVVRTQRKEREARVHLEDDELPTVTIIVPAHNEAEVIDRCLNSVKAQEYPHDKLEIIVIDDGSTDDTADRVDGHVNGDHDGVDSFRLRGRAIKVGPFNGRLALIRNGHGGKATALNAGILASSGDVIINIDSDVVLAPDTIRNTAAYFVRNPDIGAATGNIEVDWETLEERDKEGRLVLDEDGQIVPKKLTFMERFLARSQFLEYLSSFDLGRRAQAITSTMYTLAGAYSAFRREVLADGIWYSNTTVSEDTDLTFELHRKDVKIGFVDDAKIYLEPAIDWDSLYAQRVRWTRGQLEVCGINNEMIGSQKRGKLSSFALPKMLLFDHTMAFPRLVWAPLILSFPLIGYSWRVVGLALLGMYMFYLLIEIINTLTVFAIADDHGRERIEQSGWMLLLMPAYRFVVFHFRFSGFLVTLTEEQQWTMAGPMRTAESDIRSLRLRSIEIATGMFAIIGASLSRAVRLASAVVGPLLITVSVVLLRWFESTRKTS
ncbi:MAG: glycosyltransferase [Actinomycetota bacterium]|jgi:biofilm PGA synthesis N-glycosyltransferase PgaC|nr:glycosyltransferase [Actinomycetota bacterium]